jgi:chloramphenicol O-acetyltransferase type A
MKSFLDIETWARRDHYYFFSRFDEPYFGICVDIECTSSYEKCKKEGISFFLYYLHKSLVAANKVEPFRYRIENDKVFVYNEVHASPTISRPDGTFGFSYMKYYDDFQKFETEAKKEIERIQNSKGLLSCEITENIIHYSSLPGIRFNSISHARNFKINDSCPKITFGKVFDFENGKKMPVSVHVHHALVDGFNVGQFIDEFQHEMI